MSVSIRSLRSRYCNRRRCARGTVTPVTMLALLYRDEWQHRSLRSRYCNRLCPLLLHEAPDELRNLIRCGIEREMTRVQNVDFGLRHVMSIGLRFRKLERQVVFAPEDEKARLLLAHPSLPLGVGVDIRAVVVKEVALNVCLAGLVEKGKFISPEIRVIAFHVGIVPDMARPRRRQRQEICAKRAFVGSAICPKGPPRLPIRTQALIVRHSVLHDESLDPVGMGQGHAKTHGAAVILHVKRVV